MPQLNDPTATTTAYFDAWRAKDFDAFRAVLADDVTFRGPMGTAEGADECAAGIRGMSTIVTDVVVLKVLADGDDVMTWFELHTSRSETPLPTVNWSHVAEGKVDRIRVTFDPRPLLGTA